MEYQLAIFIDLFLFSLFTLILVIISVEEALNKMKRRDRLTEDKGSLKAA
jgi:hypothetical protein